MYSDSVTIAHGNSRSFLVRRSLSGDATPWSHSTKVWVWIGVIAASWAPVILAGYVVWSAL